MLKIMEDFPHFGLVMVLKKGLILSMIFGVTGTTIATVVNLIMLESRNLLRYLEKVERVIEWCLAVF